MLRLDLPEEAAPVVLVVVAGVRVAVRERVVYWTLVALEPGVVEITSITQHLAKTPDAVEGVHEIDLTPIVATLVVDHGRQRLVGPKRIGVVVVVAHEVGLPNLHAALEQVDRQLAVAHVELPGLEHVEAAERPERLGGRGESHGVRGLLVVVRDNGVERGVEGHAGGENPHRGAHAVALKPLLVLLVQDLEAARILLDDRELHDLATADLVPRGADDRVALLPPV